MRKLAKLFCYTSFMFVTIFLYYTVIQLKYARQELTVNSKIIKMEKHLEKLVERIEEEVKDISVKSDLKYILQWTNPKNVPLVYMGVGQERFKERNCPYVNCFVTSNRSLLGDLKKFDVIAFAGTEVFYMIDDKLPKERSSHQKYAFANMESADNYPVCSHRFNNFFNWTWTYKLESETIWGYIIVRDAENKIIGPKTEMHWMNLEDMDPVSDEVKAKFKNKTKAAAWFVSNCRSRSGREKYVKRLQEALKDHNLNVDVYGNCGPLKCGRDKEATCNEMIEKDYYFYLSFENSFSEDYVTEKLLYGLQHYAVPIVYGGANYTRFMPDGIYLHGGKMTPKDLAKEMNDIINDKDRYYNFFKWRNHYSYHAREEAPDSDDLCRMCEMLHDEKLMKETTVYRDFRKWWNVPGKCH